MATPSTITFLGAAETVTGSKHLVQVHGHRLLLDCGMFQGLKHLRLRNWADFPFDARGIDGVVLSHAHIDHSGHLPLLARRGFRGPIHCTPATADLLRVMLPDAAYLQEEQAASANRHRYSKHRPALPLYTLEDAEEALDLIECHPHRTVFEPAAGVAVTFRPAGHILGSATCDLAIDGSPGTHLVFSGDLGRWDRPILPDPAPVPRADTLLIEATYGNRDHPPDPVDALARVVRDAAERGGPLLVPAFAVGRTQELVWRLRALEDEGRIPVLPVYIDSPMAIRVTKIYLRNPDEHDLDMQSAMEDGDNPLESAQFTIARTVQESKQIAELRGPFIVISASGMATGGRILHHLKRWLPEPRATVLLVGFQAAGTRGRALLEGAKRVRIHGRDIGVRARVEKINGLSAHADRSELLRWLGGFETPPRRTFLVHAEPTQAAAFRDTVDRELGWSVEVARDGAEVPL